MRGLPAVHRFLSDERITRFEPLLGREAIKRAVNAVLEDTRGREDGGSPSYDSLAAQVGERLSGAHARSLVRVINGTGVILHTNLGRAPLAAAALDAIGSTGGGYSNLEFDLEHGERGSRYSRATEIISSVTGAQDAMVVNNCAAAVLLIVDTFAKGREVVASRGELVEIGGGFRLPDVLQSSGAELIEAGTTNKTYLEDIERALSPRTGLLLRSHASNFRITGFTHEVDPRELAALAKRAGVPLAEDLGSGAVCDLREYGLPHERTVQETLADGVDLAAFSGDKLLGGPQCGVIAGSSVLIARLRSNPLVRALRVGKMTFAALIETFRLHRSAQTRAQIPLYAMLGMPIEALRARAAAYAQRIGGCETAETFAYAGGGSLPECVLPSIAVALRPRDAAAAAGVLRAASPPVIARIENDRLLLDLRTIAAIEDEEVLAALHNLPA
jgi:L-seryl-tRNA(Ser) seleniumtransferase